MAGRSGKSEYFEVKGSGKKPYTVTINYDTGHFCTCRGMISKKSMYGEDAGRTQGTCCKHVKDTINTKFDGDWGVSGGKGKPRTRTNPVASAPTTPTEPSGRRAAIMAQRAKRKQETQATSPSSDLSLLDRIAALAEAREGATG